MYWTKPLPGRSLALAKVLQQRGLGRRPDVVKAILTHVFYHGIL